MTDYPKYINALRKCAKEHENDRTSFGHIIVSDLCRDTANLLEALDQEPTTGHWRAVYQGDEIIDYRCSECEFGNTFGKGTYGMNYCPNCGAKMVDG